MCFAAAEQIKETLRGYASEMEQMINGEDIAHWQANVKKREGKYHYEDLIQSLLISLNTCD